MSTTTGRILFLRHPETVANVKGFLSGRSDVALSDRGEAQRERAVVALEAWKPDLILTSPLSRCVNIAEPVAASLGCAYDVEPRLVEIEFGDIEGITHQEMVRRGYQFPWGFSETDDLSQPAPGAESFEHLFMRAKSLLSSLKRREGRTACVTHGGFTRAIMAAAYNGDLHEFWHYAVANVSSQVFSTDGRHLYLEAFGLTPEEVMRRMEDPSQMGTVNARGEY